MSDFRDWLGRQSRRDEVISARQLGLFKTVLDGFLGPDEVPLGFHWSLVPDVAGPADLGRDGHPRPGAFLPALPLPRRMWAGGELEFLAAFRAGDLVVRDSTISDIKFKAGRSGDLGLVSVDHLWSVDGLSCIRERQDLVFRGDPKPGAGRPQAPAEAWDTEHSLDLQADPVLLFRYSALTFNSHRIHYDFPYATEVEGYGGLVVHGPLQAILLLNLASRMLMRTPGLFRYRGISPLICGQPAHVEGRRTSDGVELRIRTSDNQVTMTASAR
jgi:3-methylfumaryl-CoA hydratase